MITNEAEIRIALQAVLVSVLALTGYWGCAVLVFFLLIPWKPVFAAGSYLAQPVVEWRAQKAGMRHERGLEQIEKQLDEILHGPRISTGTLKAAAACPPAVPAGISRPASRSPFRPFKAPVGGGPSLQKLPTSAHNLAATLAIPPAIKNHVRNLPQGVFSNMDLEVEDVKFHGDLAEAYVRFKSSNVSGLVIRQCYLLKKSGDHWEVESRKPTNGGGKPVLHAQPGTRADLRAL